MKNSKLKLAPLFSQPFLALAISLSRPVQWQSGSFGIYLLLPSGLYMGTARYLMLSFLMALSLVAVYICKKAEHYLGEDAGSIVIDELCGFFVATLFLPYSLMIGLYAFVLFRVFDIAKPFPIYRSQRIPNGWGVVLDDVLAGIYANILLQILIHIYPRFFGL
ncbi:MAG: phosphatidylglycerophosphatase A [Candidatus Cloacimonetes bacterium]|nr:phosphatidylglycerophosphatase A [Candidatus Cloacimonadota bacterium]